MTITKQEADTVYALARALEDTGRLCSLAESDDKLEWRKKNQETQCALQDVLRQLQEPEAISTKREFYEILQVRKYGFDALHLGTFGKFDAAAKAIESWQKDMPKESFKIQKVTRETVAEFGPVAKQEVKP